MRFATFLLATFGAIGSAVSSEENNLLGMREMAAINSSSPDSDSLLSSKCKIVVAHYLPDPDADLTSFNYHDLECEPMSESGGHPASYRGYESYSIEFSNEEQKIDMLDMVETMELQGKSAVLVLSEGNVNLVDKDTIYIASGVIVSDFMEGLASTLSTRSMEGEKKVLIVRVTDKDGQVVPETAEEVMDNIMGYNGDPVSARSQFTACSAGKFNLYADDVPGQSARGTIDVTIDKANLDPPKEVKAAVSEAVRAKMGIEKLPGEFDHIFYIYHSSAGKWAAVAAGSWYSAYKAKPARNAGVYMHEVGHNYGLKHSGEVVDGVEKDYGDHTCMMGNGGAVFKDDGAACYNGAKSWKIGWYDDRKVEVNKDNAPWSGTILGLASYENNNPDGRPVAIKLNRFSSDVDYYIQFNHATGINRNNTKEAVNEVTIVEEAGEDVNKQSWLLAKLAEGDSFVLPDFDGTGLDMTVAVNTIDIDADPGYADLSICLDGDSSSCGSTSDTEVPSAVPSSSPSTAPSVPGPPCIDSTAEFQFRKKPRTCAWALSKNKCGNRKIKRHCPLSCDTCDKFMCVNTPSKFYVNNDDPPVACKFLKSLTPEERMEKCNEEENIMTSCRKFCKYCD